MNKGLFNEFDVVKAEQFVNFWNNMYDDGEIPSYADGKPINYIKELNIGGKLSPENIKELLRWKDRIRFTINEGKDNKNSKRVDSVLKKVDIINKFRFNEIDEDKFYSETENIFRSGIIWKVFLFHIAKPHKYPIADRYIFRSYLTHIKKRTEELSEYGWNEDYKPYVDYFFNIAIAAKRIVEKPKGNESDIEDIVKKLKEVDNALVAFGRFLYTYNNKK